MQSEAYTVLYSMNSNEDFKTEVCSNKASHVKTPPPLQRAPQARDFVNITQRPHTLNSITKSNFKSILHHYENE